MKPTLPFILVLFLCLWFFAAANSSYAATLTVTKTADTNDGVCDADCSLREAVAAAASGDTIVFSSLFNTPQTITLTNGQITIDKNLTITGTGQDLVTISGNNASRIFLITGGAVVNLSGMTFRDGNVGSPTPYGGAIVVTDSTLNVSNATLTNNRASSSSGLGGVIYGGNTITLSNLIIVGNSSQGPVISGASIDIRDSIVRQNGGGGLDAITMNVERCMIADNSGPGSQAENVTIIDSTITNNTRGGVSDGDANSTMTIKRCLISGNSRDAGAGGVLSGGIATIKDSQILNNTARSLGGGIVGGSVLYLINSTVSGNTSTFSGIQDGGGGILSGGGNLFVTNSTISGNNSSGIPGTGGGISSGLEGNPSPISLINSTIINNTSSGVGGGIYINQNGNATFSNTIVSGNNSTGTSEEDVSGTIISNGINLIGNTSGSSGWIAGDLLNVNPMLAPLGDNGGSTMTHALLPGSPAINVGNNSVAIDPQTQMPLTTDQRGFLRFYGGTVDIGAYEFQPEITGTITYGNATGSPTPRFISGVLLSAVGSPSVSVTSRSDGTYTLGGFGSGAYTVTPSKAGGANGISSFDAGLIAKHVTGLQALTGNQLIVADVSGNGTLSSFDSAQIARYTAGLNSNFGASGNWIFVPVNRTYSSVNSTQADEDFVALLMGDVSGNWQPPVNESAVPFYLRRRSASPGMAEKGFVATPPAAEPKDGFGEIMAMPSYATQECEGPVGNMIVTTAAMCRAFADARADALRRGQNRLRKRAASSSGAIRRPLTEAVPTEAAAGDLTSTNRYPIMARKDLQPPATAGGSDKREIDRLIGESLSDYRNRRSVEDMAKAKAKAKAEEELRKCLPKEGELPNWADDWVENVWRGGKSEIPARRDQTLTVTDSADSNVMWRVGVKRDDPLRRVKGIDGCLFKSIDGGATWDRLHYTYDRHWKYVNNLAVARENGKTILLAGVMSEPFFLDSGIMRSDDGGQTWYRVCDGFAALSVVFDPNNSQNAIAEIIAPSIDLFVSRVVFSADGGKHWMTALRNGIALETNSESKLKVLATSVKQ